MYKSGGSKFFGAYPPSYLRKMRLLFHDEFATGKVLHLFSGKVVSETQNETTFDINPELNPDVVGDAKDLSEYFAPEYFDLILADPPYDENHVRYGTLKMNKRKVVKQCAGIVRPGGYLVWLDTIQPIWAKVDGWKLRGTIGLNQSTNHKVRMLTILEKRRDKE